MELSRVNCLEEMANVCLALTIKMMQNEYVQVIWQQISIVS